jgi:hypothetical protein
VIGNRNALTLAHRSYALCSDMSHVILALFGRYNVRTAKTETKAQQTERKANKDELC